MKKLLTACAILIALSGFQSFAKMQPVKKDGRYYYSHDDNYQHINLKRGLLFLAKRLLSPTQWVKRVSSLFINEEENPSSDALEVLKPIQSVPQKESIKPTITWVGHATMLIQINGFNILTDPIYGPVKVGPITLSKRAMPVGIKFEDLPPIDAILISHNHSDHTDAKTLKQLQQKFDPVVCVPEGDYELFKSMGFSKIEEKTWWQACTLEKNNKKLTLTFLPAFHWSIRFSLASYRKSLWGSWMISTDNTNIYFAGDTAYGPHFKEIAQEYPKIDIAMMPIGPTSKGENTHKHYHVDVTDAVEAFIDLKANCFIPMHYGTFFIGKEHLKYPIKKLPAYWQEKKELLQDKNLLMATCGKIYTDF